MKRSSKLSVALLCIAGLFSGSAMAVDGYKDLKFGTPKEQVLKSKLCRFKKEHSDQAGIEVYSCQNLKFGGKSAEAAVFLIEGKFSRLVVMQDYQLASGILNQLLDKYGAPVEQPNKQDFMDLESQPNKTVDVMFDNKTVVLRLMSDAGYNKSALIMYSAADYGEQLDKVQQKSMSDDL